MARSRSKFLQQQCEAMGIAHKTTLNELDSAQHLVTCEMEKVAKLQSDKRTMLALKEEVQLEHEARKDLETERDLMREQLNRVIRAENTGSNIWKEREAQFQRQIEMMEARDGKATLKQLGQF